MEKQNVSGKPTICIRMKNHAEIVVELYPQSAPNAVNSILELIDQKGFEELQIQRIAPDFVLQPWFDEVHMDQRYQYVMEKEICPEFSFTRYTVGMAGNEEIASCGCIFFVMGDGCEERLNGKFTGAGKVISGFDELERIMHVKTRKVVCDMEGVVVREPVIPEVIQEITYELNGYERKKVVKRLEVFA